MPAKQALIASYWSAAKSFCFSTGQNICFAQFCIWVLSTAMLRELLGGQGCSQVWQKSGKVHGIWQLAIILGVFMIGLHKAVYFMCTMVAPTSGFECFSRHAGSIECSYHCVTFSVMVWNDLLGVVTILKTPLLMMGQIVDETRAFRHLCMNMAWVRVRTLQVPLPDALITKRRFKVCKCARNKRVLKRFDVVFCYAHAIMVFLCDHKSPEVVSISSSLDAERHFHNVRRS